MVLFSSSFYSALDVFGTKTPFSRVIVGDPSNDWTFKHFPPLIGFSQVKSPDGRPLYFDREPISISECKIRNQFNKEIFPSPGIASMSYFSDGKTLTTTIWLDSQRGPTIYNSSSPQSFLNNGNISQAVYQVSAIRTNNKTLTEAVKNHLRVTNQNVKDFHLNSNESGLFNVKDEMMYKLVYTYRGVPTDSCSNCKAMDLLIVKDDKLFILDYSGDVGKYIEFLPDVEKILNSTNLGSLRYKNPTLAIELLYPDDWSPVENKGRVLFMSAEKNTTNSFELPRAYVEIENSQMKSANSSTLPQITKSLVDNYTRTMPNFYLIKFATY